MPSFLDQILIDLDNIFLNTNEFGETHIINGKSMKCIVTSSDRDQETDKDRGFSKISKSLVVASNDLTSVPSAGSLFTFDSDIYRVHAYCDRCGIGYIDLGQYVGKFDKDITIQSATTIEVNGFIKPNNWTTYYSCKAYVRNMNAQDMLKLGSIVNSRTIFVKIPYYAGITDKMRLLFNGQSYNIKSIDNIEYDDQFIDLICDALV